MDSESAGPDPASAMERQSLTSALVTYKEDPTHFGETARAIAEYCRRRREDGAQAETVVIEVKAIARRILEHESPRLERLITLCIEHYYSD